MNRKTHPESLRRSRGVTLIEILLVISALVIVLSFAIPSMSNVTAKADMTAAVENVEYSIATARNTARLFESGVTIEFKTYAGEAGQAIAFTPGKRGLSAGIPEYRLPEGIELVTDQESFVFDQRGLVENPGSIILVSRVDEAITETIPVN
jgi:prepilin-type N-terminal cleavage/methylation domain-containing protein